MKRFLTYILFCIPVISFGQLDSSKSNINIYVGPATLGGDGEQKAGISGGIGFERALKSNFSIELQVHFGSLSGGAWPSPKYTYASTTGFIQPAVLLKYGYNIGQTNLQLTPFVGVGYNFYNAQVKDKGAVIRVSNGTLTDPKLVSSAVIPMGLNLKYLTKGKVNLGLSYSFNAILSDTFDGTVGTTGLAKFNGHTYKGKVEDISVGKSKNDAWVGLELFAAIRLK